MKPINRNFSNKSKPVSKKRDGCDRVGKNAILVTGAHRSGTTWVGRMLACAPSVAYIQEPFHIHHDFGTCGADFRNWYTYISSENEGQYCRDIAKTVSLSYNLSAALRSSNSKSKRVPVFRDFVKFTIFRTFNYRLLIKDPLAFFAAEWLANRFNLDVILLIRHPAAFAGSLKHAQWSHPFRHFLRQPLLMRDHLDAFKTEIEKFAHSEQDIVEQAILLWKIIYGTALKLMPKHREWLFVRHEDISLDPVACFRDIFQRINLKFSRRAERAIIAHSLPADWYRPESVSRSIQRNSKANIWNWRNRLTVSEIDRIRREVEETSGKFYTDSDWEPRG